MVNRRLGGLTVLSLLTALGIGAAACASNPPPGDVVYVERRPPPNQVEVIGVAPGPGFIWVSGLWRWGGNDYVWVPGRWAAREARYHAWVPGHWRHTRRGWYFVEGHWR